MTSKLQIKQNVVELGRRWLSEKVFVKGSSLVLASNALTQLCQVSWKYRVKDTIHEYVAKHTGASGVARVIFGWQGDFSEITEGQRQVLVSGLLASRMSPSRSGLLASLMWAELSNADKNLVLAACFDDDDMKKAHAKLFDALAAYASAITEENKEEAPKRKKASVTFADLAFESSKRKSVKPTPANRPKKAPPSAESAANAATIASGGKATK